MLSRFLAAFALCLLFIQSASACRYEPVKPEESLAKAERAFIGTVKTVENRLAILKVEKAVKGVKEGDEINVEIEGSSCAIRFQPGQRWLYFGPDLPSGSILLQDEMGRSMDTNIKLVADKLKIDAGEGSDVIGGTAERSCAPWDGAAFMLTLDNGITAHGYAGLEQGEATRSYIADNTPERGHGFISQCPQGGGRQRASPPCNTPAGTIFIGSFDGKTLKGAIETEEGEHHSRYIFRLKWLEKPVYCG